MEECILVTYSSVVLLITAAFFCMYIFIIKKHNMSRINTKTSLGLCIVSAVLSIVIPITYIWSELNERIIINLLLGLSIAILMLYVFSLFIDKKGDMCRMTGYFSNAPKNSEKIDTSGQFEKNSELIDVEQILQEIVEDREKQIDLTVDEIQKELQDESEKQNRETDSVSQTEDVICQNSVDSVENIDKMGLENCIMQQAKEHTDVQQNDDAEYPLDTDVQQNDDAEYPPDIDGLTIEESINMAFSCRQKGNLELAALYYMNLLDKHLPKDLALMVLLDVCALYKEMGNPEMAKNVLEGYISKFSEMLDTEQKEQIAKNLE